MEMATGAQSGEDPRTGNDERIRSQVTKSNGRPIILAGAVVLALGVAVFLRSGSFSTGAPAPSLASQISAAEALGKGDEAWRRKDYAEAAHWYRRAADQGNSEAQNNVGWLYENGRGVAQDYGEAMRWYRAAADSGGAVGQVNVGRLYANGRGVPQDYSEAMHWYRKAADRGDATAQYDIGWSYENGWGV